MAAAQTVLQVCGRGIPSPFSSKAHLSRSWSGSRSRPSVNYKRRKAAPSFEVINRFDKSCKDNVSEFPRSAHSSFTSDHFGGLIRCNCERAEGVRGYNDNAKDHNAINGNRPNVELDKIKESISESAAFSSNGGIHSNGAIHDTLHEGVTDSIEEEAWDLLRESIVYYCNTPVGTIAAKDPSESTNILNYDHVFIRDFIPSGIAFLLKGEYDIVRNFLLHTLQLQSWEKTMDCHSPGQGLMPASFKVRTVPLEGEDTATEEILDPDFGEAAIGRRGGARIPTQGGHISVNVEMSRK